MLPQIWPGHSWSKRFPSVFQACSLGLATPTGYGWPSWNGINTVSILASQKRSWEENWDTTLVIGKEFCIIFLEDSYVIFKEIFWARMSPRAQWGADGAPFPEQDSPDSKIGSCRPLLTRRWWRTLPCYWGWKLEWEAGQLNEEGSTQSGEAKVWECRSPLAGFKSQTFSRVF